MLNFIIMIFSLTISILQLWIVIRSDSDKRLNIDHTEKLVALLKEKSIKGKILLIGFLLQLMAMMFLISTIFR
jgi:hypothetical protein